MLDGHGTVSTRPYVCSFSLSEVPESRSPPRFSPSGVTLLLRSLRAGRGGRNLAGESSIVGRRPAAPTSQALGLSPSLLPPCCCRNSSGPDTRSLCTCCEVPSKLAVKTMMMMMMMTTTVVR